MEKEKLIELVGKAKSGDPKAIEDLLCQAHTSVSYQCRKMLPNPQDAEDLTQEILLTVYQKLDTLQEPAAFWSWLNRITATRCINALRRTHVDLQFAEDEDGSSVLDSLETLDEYQVPDKAIDNAETARMIDEIVSGLPEAQRISTLLYYYDEMSVKEIAKLTAVSENTVKSRLNLARKAIKEKVQDYEKQGVKLYSISVLPFLWYFLRSAARSEADAAAAAACAANVIAANSAVEAATTAGTAATRAAGFFSKKVIAGVIAGAVVIGGITVAAIQLINEFAETVPAFICQHEWAEATCTEPKTCQKCGSTEGEALGHVWLDATCVTPKTCAVCGAVEGEALGHTWIDATCVTPKTCAVCGAAEGEALGHSMLLANFQQPATCEVCGFTEGEPLEPIFITEGRECNVVLDTEYDYIVPTSAKPSVTTTATAVFHNYQIFPSSDTLPGKEGYEWRTVEVDVTFHDQNAWYYGFTWGWIATDYYGDNPNIPALDGYPYTQDEVFTENVQHFFVTYNGEVFTDCMDFTTRESTGWLNDKTQTLHFVHHVFVPVGYDGCVFGIYDGYENEWTDEMSFMDVEPKSMLLFRLA